MLKRFTFTLLSFVLALGLAFAQRTSLPQATPGDTLTYYLDGKVVNSTYFQTLDANTLAFIDVNKQTKTVRGFTKEAAPTDVASYQSRGTKIDWSVARELRDVSFLVNNQVTDAHEARAIASEQIEHVYQLPPSATGDVGEAGTFGKNGVIVITTKKK
ncbi:hypothetical protein GCM10028819_48160 [Spirosoma humi]